MIYVYLVNGRDVAIRQIGRLYGSVSGFGHLVHFYS